MTKTTEELKRVMYSWLSQVKMLDQGGGYQLNSATNLENSLEAYLEALRQDRIKFTENRRDNLEHCLSAMTEERDQLRNKLQAFEFANRSAAELLSEALREQSGLRKSAGSMGHQSSDDHCSNAACACSNSSLWPSAETPKPIPMIIRAEFDDRIRTTCTACNRSEDVFK